MYDLKQGEALDDCCFFLSFSTNMQLAGIWLLNSNHMDSKLALQHRRSHNVKRKSFKMGSWFFDLMYNSWFIFIFLTPQRDNYAVL